MRNHPSLLAGLAGVLVVLAAAACGKKGPPLPPLNIVPGAPEEFKVRRLGSTVYVHFKIPSANRDGTKPADVARVDVYGYTGLPASVADVVENGTLVARVPVRRPPEPEEATGKGKKGAKGKKGDKPGGTGKGGELDAGTGKAAAGVKGGQQAPTGGQQAQAGGQQAQAGGQQARAGGQQAQAGGQQAQAGGQNQPGGTTSQPTPRPAPQPGKKPRAPEPGFDQGAAITVTEEISPALLQPVLPKQRRRRAAPEPPAEAGPLWSDPSAYPVRAYIAIPFNHHGRPGAPTTRVLIPLVTGADAPAGLKVGYDEQDVTVSWDPSPTRRLPVQDGTLSTNLPSTALGTIWCQPIQDPVPGQNLPSRSLARGCDPVQAAQPIQTLASTAKLTVSTPTRYNVYAVKAPPPAAPAAAAAAALPGGLPTFEMPVPLNDKPLDALTFSEKRGDYGVERCYVARAVDTFGGGEVESRPTSTACVTPKDIFPPAAPKGLGAVAGGGAINLIWEPNTEPDLAGYLVLRAEAGSDDLRPITPSPITETTYRDATVKVGVRYVYAVVAVDKATPPNVSGRSNTVEETAR